LGRPRQALYWKKKNPKPRLRKVDFRVAIESMFWGCKKDKGHFFNWELGQQNNIVECAVFLNTERTGHPTQKPTPVLIPWIKYLCPENGIVLDPFVGSGSTLVACQKLNRNAIGYDIDPKMEKIMEKRLKGLKNLTNIDHY
jgi:DNA modification methylase